MSGRRVVIDMDMVFTLSERQYERLLAHIAADGGEFDLERDFKARPVADRNTRITDLDADEALTMLEDVRGGARVARCVKCDDLDLKVRMQPIRGAGGRLCHECASEE